MKRYFEKTNQLAWKARREDKIAFLIAGILSLIIGVFLFLWYDTTPATALDYKQFKEQASEISETPMLLFKTKAKADFRNEIIVVEFENDQCRLIVQYAQNFEIVSMEEIDKCKPLSSVIPVVVLIIFTTFGGYLILISVLIAKVERLCVTINKKIKAQKRTS